MDKANAKRMSEKAREYVGDNVFTPHNFDDVDLRQFLRTYLWVIHVAGFRNEVVEKHFDVSRLGPGQNRCHEVDKRRRAPDP